MCVSTHRVATCRLQVVLDHAAAFLQANASSLDVVDAPAPGPKYAFEWLQLADTAGLAAACNACIDRIVALNCCSCTPDKLESLSRETLMHLIGAVVAGAGSSTSQKRCGRCNSTQGFNVRCPRCNINDS
jgi:hypothetical protein